MDSNKGIHVEDDVAIELCRASKHYKSSNKKTPVLVGLTMKVMKGQIYGLLGSGKRVESFGGGRKLIAIFCRSIWMWKNNTSEVHCGKA